MTHASFTRHLLSKCTIFIPFALAHQKKHVSTQSKPDSIHDISDFQNLTNLQLQKLILIARHGHRTGRIRLNIEDGSNRNADRNGNQETVVDRRSNEPPVEWKCPSLYHVEIDSKRDSDPLYESYYESTHLKGNCLRGQLTEQGALQMKTLGTLMNQYYAPFLKQRVKSLGDIYCRSSDVHTRRTEESLKYFLGGFIDEEHPLRKYCIPIALREPTLENLFPMFTRCPRLSRIIAKKSDLQWVEEEAQRFGVWDLISRINTSETMNPLFPLSILNTLRSYTDIGLNLPSEVVKEESDQLEMFCSSYSQHLFDDEVGLQLGIGRLMHELLENIEHSMQYLEKHGSLEQRSKHAQGTTRSDLSAAERARCVVILGHDTTILPLVTALTHRPILHPHFASNLIFELYTAKGDLSKRYIRILHDGKPLRIPALSRNNDALSREHCVYDLDAFEAHAAPYAVSNTEYYELCRFSPGEI